MQFMEWIIKLGAIITALIGIWKLVVAVIHLVEEIKETKEYVMNNIKSVESIPLIEEHCRENYLAALRLTIMSKDMPIGERMSAGEKYLDAGGNGEIKNFLINKLHINEIQKD